MNKINDRIQSLRKQMKHCGLDAYIVPSTDPHQGEYIPEHWQCRQWLSGFTGSAGTLVVTQFFAGVWTDSRYFIQAEEQLRGSGIELVKLVIPHNPEFIDWLKTNLPPKSRVGVDAWVISSALYQSMSEAFRVADIKLSGDYDLPGKIWIDRPELPLDPVFEHSVEYTGADRSEKLVKIRQVMQQHNADYHLVCTLDDIAWTLNLRGKDVDYNPVFVSYLLIGREDAYLFVLPGKTVIKLEQILSLSGVKILDYNYLESLLKQIISGKKVLFQSAKTNEKIAAIIRKYASGTEGQNIPILFKSMKNEKEIALTRRAMEKDGAALVRFFMWLENILELEGTDEYTCGEMLAKFRSQMPGYVGESFSPIVGYAGHGAIVHYSAGKETAYPLKKEGILLVDSGGQYLDGTTDITRTVSLGNPAPEQQINFTLVLKGHIRVAMARFPYGTRGFHFDTLARYDLWQELKNYGHGTGHGVGFFLNVHEGPQGISPNPAVNQVFEPGMITSNEPGLYIEGEYGIRIENLILSKELPDSGTGRWLEFETLSLFPIDLTLVDSKLLTEAEKSWLNNYHTMVYDRLSPHLTPSEKEWLIGKTQKV